MSSSSFGVSDMLILSEYVDMQASGQAETVRASYMAKQKELESTNAMLTARRFFLASYDVLQVLLSLVYALRLKGARQGLISRA